MKERRKRVRFRLIPVLTITSAIVGFVALFLMIYLYWFPKKYEVFAQVLSSEELTLYASEAELSASYKWAGEEVANLWKMRINFVNSGGETIVGIEKRDITNDGLNFAFPNNTRILKIQKENGTDDFENKIIKTKENQFQIQFRQWRIAEYIIASFYIASDESLNALSLETPGRDIIDGDVIVQDLTDRKVSAPLVLIDRSPRYFSIPGKIMSWSATIIWLILAFVLISMGSTSIVQLTKIAKWKKRYLEEFTKYLNKIKEPPMTKKDRKYYTNFPNELPEEIWDGFEGKKLNVGKPEFSDKSYAILYTIFGLFLIIGGICAILMFIPA